MAVLTPGVPFVSTDAVISVDGLAPGTHRFRLEVEDESGNRSQPDECSVVVTRPLPLVSDLRPRFGAFGAAVTLVGSGFGPDPQQNRVAFNVGVDAPVLGGSATELQLRVPQSAVTGPVELRNPGGAATSPRPFVIARVAVSRLGGPTPFDLALDARRNELWVVHGPPSGSSGAGAVSVLDPATQTLAAVVPLQAGAREIAVAPSGDRQAAALSNGTAASVTIIDVASRQVRAQVAVSPGPAGLAFRPDGRIVYVVCRGDATAASGLVIVIDLADQPRVVARIALLRQPARVVFSADGKLAFVNEVGSGTVAIIDAAAHQLVDRVKVGGAPTSQPSEVALARATFPLLVANPGTNNLSLVAADRSVSDVDAGSALAAAAIDQADGRGWLAGAADRLVLTIEAGATTPKRLAAAAEAGGPKSVVADGRGRGVLVANPTAKSVTVLASASAGVQAVVPVPDRPSRGVCTADGRFACFICDGGGGSVAVIEVASVLP